MRNRVGGCADDRGASERHGRGSARDRPGRRPPGWDRSARDGRSPGHARPPWPRDRRAYPAWPPGAVLGAVLFHVVGAHNAAEDGSLLRGLDPMAYAILLIGPVALFWRRRFPVTVFAVAAAASILFAARSTPDWSYAIAPGIALVTLARQGRPRAAAISAGAALVSYLLALRAFAGPLGVPAAARPTLGVAILIAVGSVLVIALGGAAKVRAEQSAQLARARAERERAQDEQERRQASEERLRIARELHDVLGHHLSLINVQAGVGLHLMENRPEQAREALAAIKTASSEALREVRSVLGVLRTEQEAAPRQPAPGLSRLADLTAGAGLPVTTTITGEPWSLPAEVDRAAYRIVQEALTNVRRHAGPGASARIAVGYLPTALHLSVRDDGPAPPAGAGPPAVAEESDGRGSGIAGMRARVAALGGRFEAGTLPAGGFLVSVLLPTDRSGPAESTNGAGPGGAARDGDPDPARPVPEECR